MKVTAYGSLIFFVCLNLSLYLLNTTQVLPNYTQSPYEEPAGIQDKLIHFDLSATNLLIGVTVLGVGAIIGYITGHLVFGGTIAIVLLALDLIFPVVKWILFGFPIFLGQIGVPLVITVIIQTLMAVIWFWFIMGMIGQRGGWEH